MGIFTAAAILVTGCSTSVEPTRPDGPGVTGRMVLVDDTGRAPVPDPGGAMLVIPEVSLPHLWRALDGEHADEAAQLPYTVFATEPALVAAVDASIVPVDAAGHFRLTQTGRHLLCRIPASGTSGAAAGSVRGCDLVDLPVSGRLRVTYGEGGLHAGLL